MPRRKRGDSMTNTLALKAKIVEAGLNLNIIAEKLNISRNSLYMKINNKRDFSASEICKLVEILHLNPNEVMYIFLNAA